MPSLPGVLDRIRAALAGHEVTFLAVDDGSTDGTAAGLAAIDGLEVVTHPENRGAGAAMGTGLAHVRDPYAIVYDADEAYDPSRLGALLEEADADVVTLSPYHPDGGVEGVGPIRLFLSRMASTLYRRRLRSPLHTFTCAVRAYRMENVRPLLPPPDDFTAAAWLMASALRHGMVVREVPAVLRVRAAGSSKMRVLRTIRAHLRLLRDLRVTPPAEDAPSA